MAPSIDGRASPMPEDARPSMDGAISYKGETGDVQARSSGSGARDAAIWHAICSSQSHHIVAACKGDILAGKGTNTMKNFAVLILRVTLGALLMGHGGQKLFGWFEGPG